MKLSEVYRKAKAAGKSDVCRFMRDMRRAGLRLRYYEGRFWWKGPAVVADRVGDVMCETRVKCQWDDMGLGCVVYPRQGL
jgi:hypothetical protein